MLVHAQAPRNAARVRIMTENRRAGAAAVDGYHAVPYRSLEVPRACATVRIQYEGGVIYNITTYMFFGVNAI